MYDMHGKSLKCKLCTHKSMKTTDNRSDCMWMWMISDASQTPSRLSGIDKHT